MASAWTHDTVAGLAPDASAVKAGEGLGKPGKWSSLGRSPDALWGEIKGSGSKPYQVRVDLDPFAHKCSCPSRKLPCKHTLGLLFVLADQPDALPPGDPPAWVGDWLADRKQRADKKQAKAQTDAKPEGEGVVSDPAAQAKRAAKRTAAVQAGVEELGVWLSDLVRQGLASARTQPSAYWDAVAARMVDAQAPGLAYAVQSIAECALSGGDWQARTLRRIGSLHLLLEAFRRIDQLAPDLQATVRSLVGWTVTREELQQLPAIRDTWLVVGSKTLDRNRLREQRTWLWGRANGRPALVLQYAPMNQPFATMFAAGTQMEAELAFYPGASPLRAGILQTFGQVQPIVDCPAGTTIDAALAGFGSALAGNPWLRPWPMLLADVVPQLVSGDAEEEHWQLCDAEDRAIDCPLNLPCGWDLLAVSGGASVTVFGEWDCEQFTPMGVWVADGREFVPLGTEEAAASAGGTG